MTDYILEKICCNVLLIGKTGSGKSSFANYLFDRELFSTGAGMPVTQWEDNFQSYHVDISGTQVNVFDSVGLEPDNYRRWMVELKEFLIEKEHSRWKTANDIMHVLFYVVNGAEGRVEPNELSIMRQIQQDFKLPVVIVITNCDIAEADQIATIVDAVRAVALRSVRVCSVSKRTRSGEKKERFGREKAVRELLAASYERVGKELTVAVYKRSIDLIRELQDRIEKAIDDSDISIWNVDNFDTDFLDDVLGDVLDVDDLSKFIPPAYRTYYDFVETFDVNFRGREILEDTLDEITRILESLEDFAFLGNLERHLNNLEQGNLFEKVGAFVNLAAAAIFLKSTIKKLIGNAFGELQSQLAKHLRKVEKTMY